MKHTIIVIGGGISGLVTLHYLKKKYHHRDDCEIVLLERNDHVGGVLNTVVDVGARFETGAGAFINNQPQTFDLVKDLNLNSSLIKAKPENKRRFLCVSQKLYPLPNSPLEFLQFPLLEWKDKWRVIREATIPPGAAPEESMDEFLTRRLNRKIADLFGGAIVGGIYAGNPKELLVKTAFPTIYRYEQEFGSITRGIKQGRKSKAPKRMLYSFKNGMGELVLSLQKKYFKSIVMRQDVESIEGSPQSRYSIVTSDKTYRADQVFITVPAYRAAGLLSGLIPSVVNDLKSIHYAPLALVGFVCSENDFLNLPQGFGYLKPTFEESPVLGVLFEDQIMENRTQYDQCLLRVMIGGMSHPDILQYSKKEIIGIASQEIIQTLGFRGEPFHVFFKAWNNAIPQYDHTHSEALPRIKNALECHPQVILSGSYVEGVSVNDCISNAFKTVEHSSL